MFLFARKLPLQLRPGEPLHTVGGAVAVQGAQLLLDAETEVVGGVEETTVGEEESLQVFYQVVPTVRSSQVCLGPPVGGGHHLRGEGEAALLTGVVGLLLCGISGDADSLTSSLRAEESSQVGLRLGGVPAALTVAPEHPLVVQQPPPDLGRLLRADVLCVDLLPPPYPGQAPHLQKLLKILNS